VSAAPLTWADGNLIYGRSMRDPWAVYSLACAAHELRPAAERMRSFAAARGLLIDLEADVQLLRPHRWWDPDEYVTEMLQGPHSAAKRAYVLEQAEELDGGWQPAQTFLSVSLNPSRTGPREQAGELLADPTSELGRWRTHARRLAVGGARLDPAQLTAHRNQAADILQATTARLPGSAAASRAQVEWLVRRAWTRGLGDPLLDDDPASPPQTADHRGRPVLRPCSVDLLRWTGYLRPEGRRMLLAEGELGPSYQVGLIASTMPGDAEAGDEVLELLFGPQDDLCFPLDVAACCRYIAPDRARGEVEREMAKADEQLDEQDQASRGASGKALIRAQTARDVEEYLDHGLPLFATTFTVMLGAESPEELKRRARETIATFRSRGMQLRLAVGQQRRIFSEQLPAQRSWTTGFARRLTADQLAAMAPAAAHHLGSGTGWAWGLGRRSPTVLRYSPEDGPRLNVASGVLMVGDSGAGKTMAQAKMAKEAFLDGAGIFDFCAKADDHHWITDPEVAPAAVSIALDAEDDALAGLLDPWVNAPRQLAAAGSLDFLTSLLPDGLPGVWHTELLQAVRSTAQDSEHPTNHAVLEALEARGRRGRDVAEHLGAHATSGLPRLGFARDRDRRLDVAQVTHVQMENLPVPERGVARQEWGVLERQGAAIAKLITLLGLGVLSSFPDAFKLFFFDEGKTLIDHPAGRRMIDQLQRLGRSKKAAAVVGTQYAVDIGLDRDSIGGLFGTVMAFRAPDEESATRSCELLRITPAPSTLSDLLALPSGTAYVRDQRGQVEVLEIRVPSTLAATAQTNPYQRTSPPGHAHA